MLQKTLKVIVNGVLYASPLVKVYRRNILLRTCTYIQICSFSSHKSKSKTYYYDVLGLTPKATQSQIKNSFYKLSKLHHPDVSKDPASVKYFHDASEAYEILGNKHKRRLYDRGVLHPFSRPGSHDPSETDFPSHEGFKARHRHAPRGRTDAYNFDEFYRQHYGNQQRRSQEEKAHRQSQIKSDEDFKRSSQIIRTYLYSALAVLAGLLAQQYRNKKR